MQTTFMTQSGKQIELAIVKGEVRVTIAGNPVMGGVDLIEHATHGVCVKPFFGNTLIPVPAASQQSVKELFAHAQQVRDANNQFRADQDAHEARVNKAMED